eukprot:TRINITY_DN3587_c0_g2_i1.p1 TRINITY_DN3587_c0_g2~~TRINITY_DN3587_c0_g2_i1.p1  ORF type:complete len:1301 (-),score=293.12 TRINITY_DN3587_c0_g2_i1:7-3909(-)
MATRSRGSTTSASTTDKKGKSPATGRGRGKGKGKDITGDDVLLGTLRTQDDLSRSHIRNVYNIDAICEKKKHTMNCKSNPNCLACLGESHLFSDTILVPPALFGHDPRTMMREKGAPGGLRNLGATCYMNSLLQCLFMNVPFREAVYNFSGNDDLCNELKNLFANLQGSSQKYYDPRPLLNVTRASSGEQQDVQEYYKMLSTYLEELWREADSPTLANFMPQSFYGDCAYITTCKGCGRESRNMSSFSELELAIKGSKSIEESLAKYIQKEELDGENQYFCQGCNQKQDATRAMALLRLPPVLTVQLLRFVFDMQTLAKRKVRDGIIFPHVLDMSAFMHRTPSESKPKSTPEPTPTSRSRSKKAATTPTQGTTADHTPNPTTSEEGNIYDLAAVVMHRGNAFGGHYIAHIRDHQGVWWQCDDEDVKRIDAVAVGVMDDTLGSTDQKKKNESETDTTTADGTETEGNVKATPKKRKKAGGKAKKGRPKKKKQDQPDPDTTLKDEDVVIDDDNTPSSTQGRMRSTTAYMLVYSRRQAAVQQTASSSSPSSSSSSSPTAPSPPSPQSSSGSSLSAAMPHVPPALDAKLGQENREFQVLIDRYNRLIGEYEATVRERREEYTKIKEMINVPTAASTLSDTPSEPQTNGQTDEAQLINVDDDQDNEEEYNWISVKWLRRWASGGGTQSPELLELTRAQRQRDEARKKAEDAERTKRDEIKEGPAHDAQQKVERQDDDVVLVDAPSSSSSSSTSSASSTNKGDTSISDNGASSTLDDANSMVIDNTDLVCSHARLNPRQLENMKRISRSAWNSLVGTYGGGPELDQGSLCAECVYSIATDRQGMQQSSADKQRIIDIVAEGDEMGYYICKAWYNEWKKRNPDLEKAGLDIVEGIVCDHGKMSPYPSDRKPIPIEAWSYFQSLGFQASREFSIDDETAQCEECLQTEAVSKVETAERKTRRVEEKKSLQELYTKISDKSTNSSVALHHAIGLVTAPVDDNEDDDVPGSSSSIRSGSWLYLVDREWALKWRSYIDDPSVDDCPETITNHTLMCEHNLAQYNVAFELERRLSPTPETSEPAPLPFFVIKEATWNMLLARYSGMPVRFRLEKDGVTYEPDMCTICMEQRTRDDLVRKHNFTDGFVNIQMVTPNSNKSGTGEPSTPAQPTLQDTANRTGRGRYGLRRKNNGKKIEGLNAFMTLSDLKLKICEALGYSPIQQELSYHDNILSEKEKTLMELGIMSGVTLKMRLLEDEMDIMDSDVPSGNQVETGFRNTIFQRSRNSAPKEEMDATDAPMFGDDSEDGAVDRN